MAKSIDDIIPIDACVAAPGASFEDALAEARKEDYEYLIYDRRIFDVATGCESVTVM